MPAASNLGDERNQESTRDAVAECCGEVAARWVEEVDWVTLAMEVRIRAQLDLEAAEAQVSRDAPAVAMGDLLVSSLTDEQAIRAAPPALFTQWRCATE